MMAWNAGYVADVPYVGNFVKRISPAWMSLAATAAHQIPPDISKPFRYLELGCGFATSTLVCAAANPHAEFVAVDFMPEHVAFANRAIQRTGLTNLKVIEASFSDLVSDPASLGGTFDFITTHGVYTWVRPEVQADLRTLIGRHSAPGCLIYIGYNALPGWTSSLSLQSLLRHFASAHRGTSAERFVAAIKQIKHIRDMGSRALGGPTTLTEIELSSPLEQALKDPDDISQRALSYLAHEYLNEHWKPKFLAEMCEELSDIKLRFLASAALINMIDQSLWSPEQADMISAISDSVTQEIAKDMILPSSFRRDIFVRGRSFVPLQVRNHHLAQTTLALARPAREAKGEYSIREQGIKFDDAPIKMMATALENGPKTVGEIQAILSKADISYSALEITAMLADMGIAEPVVRGRTGSSLKDFNMNLLATAKEAMPMDQLGLASPVTGSGIQLSLMHLVLYEWLADGKPETTKLPNGIRESALEWEPIFVSLGML